MSSVCLYFQVHQPFRVRRYSFFQVNRDHNYFDDQKNAEIMRRVTENCYLPANEIILKLLRRFEGGFRIAFSFSGVAIEQMKLYAPDALKSFQELVHTGCVEILGETYQHSLASLYDEQEFIAQVLAHTTLMREVFDQTPQIFRNTELIYNDAIGHLASDCGFHGVLAESVDDVLNGLSNSNIFKVPDTQCRLLLKNYRLSDDIAFRFSNQAWSGYPLTAQKYARWIHAMSDSANVVNLFMDYETFGEHQWASTGIFDFLNLLPGEILRHPEWNFLTPSQVCGRYPAQSELSFPRTTSWADVERDVSAWQGNRMQQSALQRVYELGNRLRQFEGHPEYVEAFEVWRKLLTSDHFYYMSTKWFSDGDVHKYFSPFESPYEAFINYMNVLRDFSERWFGNASDAVMTLG